VGDTASLGRQGRRVTEFEYVDLSLAQVQQRFPAIRIGTVTDHEGFSISPFTIGVFIEEKG
jgi:hypothetical protein